MLPTLAAPQTVYAYNLDKQLGTQTLSYDEKGRLVITTTSDNQTLSYAYDGSLPLSETWEGTIAGSF